MANSPDRTADVQSSLLRDDDLSRGRNGEAKVPVPMMPSEIVNVETACWYAVVVDKTIREWVKRDAIGRQSGPNAKLQISFPALLMRIDCQMETLERLRAGDRDHPAVVFYLRRAVRLQEETRTGADRRLLDSVRMEMRSKTGT